MTACDFSVFGKFDLGACASSLAFGWVPSWVWPLLPYWPYIVIIGGAGMAYRFAGWPGVAAFFGGVGFIAGRKSVEKIKPVDDDEIYPDPDKPVRTPQKVRTKPASKARTIFDIFMKK